MSTDTPKTRLAPSPTGALHLGNARTFLVNWAMARQGGWSILLRIEDLDGPRIKPDAERQLLEVLGALGMDWDEGPVRQSDDPTPYHEAMRMLASRRAIYPCGLTRRQIEEAASAPHEGERAREQRFPPELRPEERPEAFMDEGTNWRLAIEDEPVRFEDAFAGPQERFPARTIGDIVVWTKRREPSYQLAVVVDDDRQGVTEIVRGDDLLDSAARQTLIRRALGRDEAPRHTHLPLVLGPDGRRLAKRHGDTRIATYLERGASAARIIGLIAGWCGLERAPMSAQEFAAGFSLDRMPRETVTFGAEDERWLLDT